jgi:hypothetical protein
VTPLRRCWDLTEAHLKEAAIAREAMARLLREMAAVARPDSGATKILLVLARLAKPSIDWLDGGLRVELDAAGEKTRFTIMEDLGGGVRELVFPRFVVDAPLSEFDRSLHLGPRAVAPLAITRESDEKLVLTNKKLKSSSLDPPSFELAEDCLRSTPPAKKSVAPPPKKSVAPPPKKGPPPLPPRVASGSSGAKRASKRPPADVSVLEIPRVAKVLDFGDLADDAAPAKRPSRRPPR